jgi:hypothetical protein
VCVVRVRAVCVCCEGKSCLCVLWTNTAICPCFGLTHVFARIMDYYSSLFVVWTNIALCLCCGLTQLFAFIVDYHSSLLVVWTNTALCL